MILTIPSKRAQDLVEPLNPLVMAKINETHLILMHHKSPAPGSTKSHYALHHAQVEKENPLNFFVINPQLLNLKENTIAVVINPKIIDKKKESKMMMNEGCMSFPFRGDKKVHRYNTIKVEYMIPSEKNPTMFEKKVDELSGLMAQIFQHEIEHTNGSHIYK